jgi:serine/threonine-protein kinase RsbW
LSASYTRTRRSRRPELTTSGAGALVLWEEQVPLQASAVALDHLHRALARLWPAVEGAASTPLPEDWRLSFAIAVAEIANNAVRHAYPPGRTSGPIELRLRVFRDRIEARFADCGVMVAPMAHALLPPDPAALAESGYGLALARAAVDRLSYRRTQRGANCWRLTKRFPDFSRETGAG